MKKMEYDFLCFFCLNFYDFKIEFDELFLYRGLLFYVLLFVCLESRLYKSMFYVLYVPWFIVFSDDRVIVEC